MRLSIAPTMILLTGSIGSVAGACGGDGDDLSDTEVVCALNDEFAAMNERTLPDIENDPIPDPAMSEENFTESIRLLRAMADEAPEVVARDLATYAEYLEWLSDAYAAWDYDRPIAWDNIDYDEYPVPEVLRARLSGWLTEHCGNDLQG